MALNPSPRFERNVTLPTEIQPEDVMTASQLRSAIEWHLLQAEGQTTWFYGLTAREIYYAVSHGCIAVDGKVLPYGKKSLDRVRREVRWLVKHEAIVTWPGISNRPHYRAAEPANRVMAAAKQRREARNLAKCTEITDQLNELESWGPEDLMEILKKGGLL